MKDKVFQLLNNKKIEYEVIEYNKDVKTAMEVSLETGFPINQMLKTLLLKSKNNNFILVIIPSDKKINFEYLNNQLSDKYMLASSTDVEDITGHKIGLVTPFLLKKDIDIYIFDEVMNTDKISTGSGEKGIEIVLDPNDLLEITKAKLIKLF